MTKSGDYQDQVNDFIQKQFQTQQILIELFRQKAYKSGQLKNCSETAENDAASELRGKNLIPESQAQLSDRQD